MKKFLSKISLFGVVNSLALVLAVYSVNTTCFWEFYQPELPEGAKKLIK